MIKGINGGIKITRSVLAAAFQSKHEWGPNAREAKKETKRLAARQVDEIQT
jgi:hypothetical protein